MKRAFLTVIPVVLAYLVGLRLLLESPVKYKTDKK